MCQHVSPKFFQRVGETCDPPAGGPAPPLIGSICAGSSSLARAVAGLTGGSVAWIADAAPAAAAALARQFPGAVSLGAADQVAWDSDDPPDLLTVQLPARAGRRAWQAAAYAIGVLEPPAVALETPVPAAVTAGLAALGYAPGRQARGSAATLAG